MGSRFSIIKHPLHRKRERSTQTDGLTAIEEVSVHRLEVEGVEVGIGKITAPQRE